MKNNKELELERLSLLIETNATNSSFIKEKTLLQQKILNDLIHKYKHQAFAYNERNKRQELIKNCSLPVIKRKHHYSIKQSVINRSMINTPETSKSIPTRNREEQRSKLKELNDLIRRERTLEHKNARTILSDNIKLYKDQLRKENVTKMKIERTKKKMIFDSIVNYKKKKKEQLNEINWFEIRKMIKTNQRKMKEKTCWKHQTEINKQKSIKPKFCMFPLFVTQK